ncbi:cytochrome c biogenesis heme-transporting ATPase CcmA [Natronospirillum operosum]|uniref:Cytochrome c biogenesis heme-transporting ATPase CcmA n=1 Tax=Natronospirillum operosum TaxID=2759953 RepID=A0A4Z0WIT4_9GAMM|nr:cytochrome c biogenesis heme-transporting ATPase CcmA [Natronospirillum operosum]TGG95363.1 cytochrome c biogenesis heme-transporting ATPase CcmA [Natronospirillum operosum]
MPNTAQPAPTEPVLAARRLSCERDERLLFSDLALQLAPGEALRIAGRNGSGKTTLMRGLVGLNIEVTGAVDWAETPSGAVPWLYVGHRPGISAHLTVVENLRFLAHLRDLDPDPAALAAALEAVDLSAFDDSLGHQLSAGQQRRVLLALLYLPGLPRCWVLDEPFTALDRQGVAALEAHLRAHCEQGGSLLFSTHHEPAGFVYRTLQLDTQAAAAAEAG